MAHLLDIEIFAHTKKKVHVLLPFNFEQGLLGINTKYRNHLDKLFTSSVYIILTTMLSLGRPQQCIKVLNVRVTFEFISRFDFISLCIHVYNIKNCRMFLLSAEA